MIFTIGLILLCSGIYFALAWCDENDRAGEPTARFKTATHTCLIGVLLMVVSICKLAWRWLP